MKYGVILLFLTSVLTGCVTCGSGSCEPCEKPTEEIVIDHICNGSCGHAINS